MYKRVATRCKYRMWCKFTYGIWNMEYGIWNMECGIWNMEYGIWNMEYGIWNMEYEMYMWSTHTHGIQGEHVYTFGASVHVTYVKQQ
jgi:hypothetical protein